MRGLTTTLQSCLGQVVLHAFQEVANQEHYSVLLDHMIVTY